MGNSSCIWSSNNYFKNWSNYYCKTSRWT